MALRPRLWPGLPVSTARLKWRRANQSSNSDVMLSRNKT